MEYAIFFDAPPLFDDEGSVFSDTLTLDYADETCIGDGFEDALESSETFESLREGVLDLYGDADANSSGVFVARPVWVVAKNDGSVQKFNVVIELRIEPADEV